MIGKKKFRVESLGDGRCRVIGECVFTGVPHQVEVSEAGYQRWLEGELIQRALPETPAEEREFLISGVSPQGWRKAFG